MNCGFLSDPNQGRDTWGCCDPMCDGLAAHASRGEVPLFGPDWTDLWRQVKHGPTPAYADGPNAVDNFGLQAATRVLGRFLQQGGDEQ